MGENDTTHQFPVSVVRFGIGKELRLYKDEIAITSPEEGHEIRVPLNEIKLLTLMPGDPNPSKLILIADFTDDTSTILAEGMSNAKEFRDMSEQLRQALNNRRAWNLTCYGAIILICLSLYILYLIVAFIGTHH
jgi:hypothetical protein